MEYRDGMLVSCEIEGKLVEKATLAREKNSLGNTKWFLLQDVKDGSVALNRRGYKYSWIVSKEYNHDEIDFAYHNVTNVKELSTMRFKQGDVIVSGSSYRRVLGVCGEVYLTTYASNSYEEALSKNVCCGSYSTDHEFNSYKLYTPPVESPVIEISKDEAFRILAKERGVDVSKVRIKD